MVGTGLKVAAWAIWTHHEL